MRIGISVCSNYRASDPREGVRHMVERTAAAEAAGLDTLFVGDHHATPTHYMQNVPVLGRMLAEWGQRPAGALFLLPLWNPVLLAEQVGTLAAIAPGRFILQCALGGEAAQSAAMGVDIRRRVGMFESSLALLQALWQGDTVSEERYWHIDNARISPIPSERVEVWIGAQAPAAVARAARLGDGWIASPGLTVEAAAVALAQYRDQCALFGREETTAVIRRDVCLQSDTASAQAAVAEMLARGYRGFDPDALVVGSVQEAVDHFAALGEAGYAEVLVRNISQDQSVALATIELLEEVRQKLPRAT